MSRTPRTYRTPMPVSAADLWAWHTRPGALRRLIPPWTDATILNPGELREGSISSVRLRRALLGSTWDARYESVIPGEAFTKRQLRGPFRQWVHHHRFLPAPDGTSILEDEVTARLNLLAAPFLAVTARRAIDRLFAFRHARLTRDLARHAEYRAGGAPSRPLRIAISGSSGMLGAPLADFLSTGGHHILRLRRQKAAAPDDVFWQPPAQGGTGQIDGAALEGIDALIHLAGEPVESGRWTSAKKEAILTSRVEGTRLLARTIAGLQQRPRVMIIASGIHYYGDRGDQELAEDAGVGSGFLAEVTQAWEAAADPARQAGIRVVHLRLGLVLGARAGVLGAMMPMFRPGLGCVLGRGTQWWSWVSLDDVLGSVLHVLAHDDLRGPVNVVAPTPVTAAAFAHTLAAHVGRPLLARIPDWALRSAMGEMSTGLTMSTRAVPDRLRRSGFRFQNPTLDGALRWELGL